MYNPYGILYRKDLATKYGCAPVTDFKTLEAYLDAVKANEKDVMPFNVCGDEIEYMLRMMRVYCGWDNVSTVQSIAYINNDQKTISDVFNFAETPKFKEFCGLMKSWYDKGFWSKSALSSKVWSRTNLQEGLSGAGIDLLGGAEGTEVFTRCPSASGAELDFFDWPTFLGIFHYDAAMGDACAFPINGKDLGRTLMVYNALMTDQAYYMLAQYGIEGKHYVLENGLHALPEGVTADNNGYTYGNAGLWPLRNRQFYLTEKVFWQKALDNNKHYDDIATPNKLACFVLDTSAVQSQIAAIEQVNAQYLNPLVFGMAGDVDAAIQQYVAALKDAGSDTLMDTVKTQVAKYAADNGY
jgi:putative aldouronate transport system substrate-binding protein